MKKHKNYCQFQMMKNIRILFLIMCCIFYFNIIFSQTKKGSTYISIKSGYLNMKFFEPKIYGGLSLDILAWDKVGIHYDLLFGEYYFHMPLAPFGGAALGVIIASSEDSTGENRLGLGLLVGAITAIIPEGISYNFKLSNSSTLSPYISPLQYESIGKLVTLNNQNASVKYDYAGGGVGLRYHQYLTNYKIRISPSFEYKIYYSKPFKDGFSAGISVGLCLNN